jgi:UDP-4-amino-4,6-dideoxy-N-acetyl-beta-L-altrosamine transaminase
MSTAKPIPYGRQSVSEQDIQAVVDVLRSDFLTQGPVVPAFETRVANYCHARHAVAVNSATSALHIACLALDLGPGDWLWTSPNTFVASSNCALYCGAQVDFVDINPLTYNLCPIELERKLYAAEKLGKLPKIVVPVHFAGQSCDMVAIHALSLKYGFKIIEDASHAIGASYQQAPVGNGSFSDITVFSFHPVKIITSAEGGMAMTNDARLATRMKKLRSHGITSDPFELETRPEAEIWNYQQKELGLNYRMTELQAALGLSQMDRLDAFVARRRLLAQRYDDKLLGLGLVTPQQSTEGLSAYHLYPVCVDTHATGVNQKDLYKHLIAQGIVVNVHYIPVYLQPFYQRLGFVRGYCPNAENYYQHCLSIPMYSSLSVQQQNSVVSKLKRGLQQLESSQTVHKGLA